MDPVPPKVIVDIPKFTVVGISRRVHFASEANPETNVYIKTFKEYFDKKIAETIPNRAIPGRTYCLYYDFKDVQDKSIFTLSILVGELVTAVDQIPEGLQAFEVQDATYAQFKGGPGAIPEAARDTWMKLYLIKLDEWGYKRSYKTEFELYREGQNDIGNMEVELHVGIQQI
ncbi:unnamed protein product (macronuclear) [Paramecium tetraurelia]|uniref:AraC effector-binding domain-containing protein n=1 Tax=Paramecium tetraurelia TaxID=5888 RepID=A0EA95_PARTE|nr:uncharacterized protein GSPATT00024944001 [Paramecium tetraurelia]CAK92212.1 unnamed protein product [Paramecium tetraurelia]|eukprot:XP_001459609.1 hypothetical protein (macronuclear) [Paramecium tetraurelia strain d4-2]